MTHDIPSAPNELDWIEGQPFSARYQDIYFSRDSGLDETRHVFLKSNRLEERWRELSADEHFVIGETGFGTGLNFLAAWQLWERIHPTCRLHYFSFERHPLARHSLAQALELWSELAPWRTQLCGQYFDMHPGWHRLVFRDGRVTLTLVIGDINDCLPRFQGKAHAWFLDGFAPSKNPEMWNDTILAEVAKHSHGGATFATFTSAGTVRRALQSLGFQVSKLKGFGRKREMTCGVFEGPTAATLNARDRHAIVIGAGIAGCSTSYSLANAGWRVSLLERGGAFANGASEIAQAVLHVRLPKRSTYNNEIALLGSRYTTSLMNRLRMKADSGWNQCGTLQLDHASRRAADFSLLATRGLPQTLVRQVEQKEASELAGLSLDSGGLYFPLGGWLNGRTLCTKLADHNGILRRSEVHVSDVAWSKVDELWHVKTLEGEVLHGKIVVVANAYDALSLTLTRQLPLHRVGGQVTFVQATPLSSGLRTVLCGEGVITPAHEGKHSVGATYNHSRLDTIPDQGEHDTNLAMMRRLAPALYPGDIQGPSVLGAWNAFRCTSPDRTPLAGEMTVEQGRGLYVNLAHGSKGFCSAPLLGEAIASSALGVPIPLSADMAFACSPMRFHSGG